MAEVQIRELEKEIKDQLDRIYKLLDEKKSAEFIKIEYKRVVELISQKYLLMKDEMQKRKNQTDPTEFAKQMAGLDAHYKDDVIAIATQGILNTGLNFKIHNLINAAGGQAEHIIIQRFGRGLRIADDKEYLDYYDFVFKINDYLEGHSRNRIKILKKEGHEITIKDSFMV